MFIAILFIIVGAVFLLKNLGFISLGAWHIIWPVLLIALGIHLIWKRHRFMVWRERIWRKLE